MLIIHWNLKFASYQKFVSLRRCLVARQHLIISEDILTWSVCLSTPCLCEVCVTKKLMIFVSSLSLVSPECPLWLTLRSGTWQTLAMWWQWQLGSARPGHGTPATGLPPLPRPAPHMIPGLRHPSSSSLQILFQCQTQSWILLSLPPSADICSLRMFLWQSI